MQRLRLFVCRFRHTGAFLWDFRLAACGGLRGPLPRRRRFFGVPLPIFLRAVVDLLSVRRCRFFCAPLSIFFPCAAADFSACRCRFFCAPPPIFLRAAADFSVRRCRFFCAPLPIFLRAAADLLSVRRRPFLRAAAFCGRSRLGWRALLAAPPPRLFRGGRGRKRPPLHAKRRPIFWRRHPDLNRGVRALQALALPLGYSAKNKVRN